MGEHLRNLVVSIFFTWIGWVWSIDLIRWFFKDKTDQTPFPSFSEEGVSIMVVAFICSLYFLKELLFDIFHFFCIGK